MVKKILFFLRRYISNPISAFFTTKEMTISQYILLFIFFTIIILLFYWKSFLGYFQGDEWFYFTQFLPFTRDWYGIFEAFYKSIAQSYDVSGGGHLDPIYNVIWFLNNQFFGLHFTPYMVVSICAHILNTFLVFIFTKKLTKK